MFTPSWEAIPFNETSGDEELLNFKRRAAMEARKEIHRRTESRRLRQCQQVTRGLAGARGIQDVSHFFHQHLPRKRLSKQGCPGQPIGASLLQVSAARDEE